MIRPVLLSLLLPLLVCRHAMCAEPPVPMASGSAQVEAGFLLPGEYSQFTTVADLEARFGKENVSVVESESVAGSVERSLVLFADDPSRRAYVAFHDSAKLVDVAGITIRDGQSRWRGKHGVHVGMSLAELRKINGKPFYFSGFDAGLHGWVHDGWSPALDDDDGSLGRLDADEGEHMYFEVELGLRDAAKQLPGGHWPVDDASVSSDDPRYPRLGELVEVTAIRASTSLDDEWTDAAHPRRLRLAIAADSTAGLDVPGRAGMIATVRSDN